MKAKLVTFTGMLGVAMLAVMLYVGISAGVVAAEEADTEPTPIYIVHTHEHSHYVFIPGDGTCQWRGHHLNAHSFSGLEALGCAANSNPIHDQAHYHVIYGP